MDKYDEKAAKICRFNGSYRHSPECWSCREIIAFGRECAAEAYEDAAKFLMEKSEGYPRNDFYPTNASDIEGWADDIEDKASALRAPKL